MVCEEFRGETRHTYAIAHELLVETAAPMEQLVTHVFPLAEAKRALGVAGNRQKWKSVKVLLDPTASAR